MKLTPEQLRHFDEEGYLFFPNYFSAEEIAILKSEIPSIFQQRREETRSGAGCHQSLWESRPLPGSLMDLTGREPV